MYKDSVILWVRTFLNTPNTEYHLVTLFLCDSLLSLQSTQPSVGCSVIPLILYILLIFKTFNYS